MLRANGHANVLTVKIAASELKKTVEMTSQIKAETKKLKKKGSDGDRGADGKRHKGEDSEGYIRTDNFVWTDDETELRSAETTTRVIDWESGLSEYADIWCTILYNECGGRKVVMGKEYPAEKGVPTNGDIQAQGNLP